MGWFTLLRRCSDLQILMHIVHQGNCMGIVHGRIRGGRGWGAGGAHPLPAESALFVEECNFQCCPLLLETPKKALGHCTKPRFFREKALVHCTKPKLSPEKALVNCTNRILALEFSIFSGGPRTQN
jgi:hypothetical protein